MVFISKEQLVVSLRGGEIYVLNLIPDGMRGIRNILFEKAAAGVLASCVSAVCVSVKAVCVSVKAVCVCVGGGGGGGGG